MPRTRTFIAIPLSKPIRTRLATLQQDLAGTADVNWVEPDNLHLTLLFLGEVDDRTLPAVCRTVQAAIAAMRAFPLAVAGAGWFPNPRRPRVLWAGIDAGAAEVAALHAALEPPLLELGCYRREQRAYTPHITIGRLRGAPSDDRLGTTLTRYSSWQAGDQTVTEVHVMASELTRAGPTYSILSRAPLA